MKNFGTLLGYELKKLLEKEKQRRQMAEAV